MTTTTGAASSACPARGGPHSPANHVNHCAVLAIVCLALAAVVAAVAPPNVACQPPTGDPA